MAKQRQSYTRDDEARMWMFLYSKLRDASKVACEPKGLRIWEEYIVECNVNRTPDSLNTRFRRHMVENLHRAPLECHVMMFLYRRLRLEMKPSVKRALELKFSIEIAISENRTVKTFKRIRRQPPENQPCGSPSQNIDSSYNESAEAIHVSTNEGSSPVKRSSLNYTQQIQDALLNSRYQTRYKRQAAQIHDEDFDSFIVDSSNTQLSITEHGLDHTEDQFSSQEGQVVGSCNQVQSESIRDSCSNVNVGEGSIVPRLSALNGQQSEHQVEPIFVSSTSDTCESAYQRLYNAFANGDCSTKHMNDWSKGEEVLALTKQWQDHITRTIEIYGISGLHTEKFLAIAIKTQKKLLSLGKDNYSASLNSLEICLKKQLEDLMQRCKPPEQQLVIRDPSSTITILLMGTDSSKVPLAVRKNKVEDALYPVKSHKCSLRMLPTVDRLEKVEGLAAQIPENYENYMLRAKNAIEERIRRIKRQTTAEGGTSMLL